jgi:hypothetical protein
MRQLETRSFQLGLDWLRDSFFIQWSGSMSPPRRGIPYQFTTALITNQVDILTRAMGANPAVRVQTVLLALIAAKPERSDHLPHDLVSGHNSVDRERGRNGSVVAGSPVCGAVDEFLDDQHSCMLDVTRRQRIEDSPGILDLGEGLRRGIVFERHRAIR